MTTESINDIKSNYPDEWILLGNPEIDETNQLILSGIVLYHGPDKKQVAGIGKSIATEYEKTALFFNRVTPRSRRSLIASLFYPILPPSE